MLTCAGAGGAYYVEEVIASASMSLKLPECSGDYQIPPGGDLYLPLIVYRCGDKTQEQAAETVTAKYAHFSSVP